MDHLFNTTPSDYILQRLDRIDSRLKELEERQRVLQVVPDSYFTRDLHHSETANFSHQQCRPLSSALQEVHSKGTLMDRLHLLETRILQLTYELDKSHAASSSIREPDENIGLLQHSHDRKFHFFSSCGFNRRPYDNLSDRFHKGFNPLQGQSSNLKIKGLKEGSSVAQQVKCRNEKRVDTNQACRRWFAIGC